MLEKKRAWAVMATTTIAAAALGCNPGNQGPDKVPTPVGPDVAPPVFAGVKHAAALSETEVQLDWDAASDDVSPPSGIAYLVFVAPTPDAFDFTRPAFVTAGGSTTAIVSKLSAAHDYSFAVRAIDHAGYIDDNTAHAEATTPDKTPPNFDGVDSVKGASATAIKASWHAATDNGSDAAHIRYSVFVTTVSGKEDFAAPKVVTPYGATSAIIDGLSGAVTYYVVVRAIDAAGNVSPTTKELSSMTLDVNPPKFAGLTSATASATTINFAWKEATDDVTPPSMITYDIFQAPAPGGEDYTKPPAFSVVGVTTFSSSAFDPSTHYCFVTRARDASGNEDKNVVEVCTVTGASADTTPPIFAGLVSATPSGRTSIDLAWAPASDDYTPVASIVYDVYQATSPGGETFTTPTKTVTGTTTTTITGLSPNTTYYYVVRAKDAAGNEDANTTEKSARTAP